MKKTILAGLFLCALVMTGCSASADDLMKELIANLNEYANAAEAKSDKSKLDAIEKKIEETQKKLDALKLSDDDKKKLMEKHKEEMTKAGLRYAAAKFGGSMKELGGMLGGGMPGMPNIGGNMPNMPNIPMSPDAGKKK